MNEPDNLIDMENVQTKVNYACPDNKYDYPAVSISKYITMIIWHIQLDPRLVILNLVYFFVVYPMDTVILS